MVTMNRNKVVIVGTGQVGSTAAFAIVTHGLCNELVLIDHSAGKALGESHDLDDGSEFQDRHVKVRNGDYGDCKDADIVVLEPGRFVHDPSRSFSAVRWSSFEGREFSVRVAATYVRGQLAYDGEQIVNQPGDGMFLRPAAV